MATNEAGSSKALSPFQVVGQFLEEDRWQPQQVGGEELYRFNFPGVNGHSICYAYIHDSASQLLVYAVASARVPAALHPQAAEFLMRANHRLRIGNFEMDYGDGEVRFKSSLDFGGADLTMPLVRNAVYSAVKTLDQYLPGLMGIIHGGKTAAEAIALAEGR